MKKLRWSSARHVSGTSRWARRTRHLVLASSAPSRTDGESGNDSDRSVLLEAWLNQRTDWTKSVFTMASAAVALTVTALLAKDNGLLPVTMTFMVLSCLCFVASTVACLSAFLESANALGDLLNPDAKSQRRSFDEKPEDALKRLESIQRGGFQFGIGLLVISALAQVGFR